MSKIKNNLKLIMPKQARIFEDGLKEGALSLSGTFRDALSAAIRTCKTQSRWEIAGRISELVNRSITKDMLDKYTSACPDCGFRAEDLPAFCHATGSIEPLRVLVESIGYELVGPEEAELVRMAKMEKKVAELQTEIALLRSRNGIR